MSSYANSHSSDVDLRLVIGDTVLELARVSPQACTLRKPAAFPAGEAELVIVIDGHEQRYAVYLPDGILPSSHQVKYITREPLVANL